MVILVMSPMHGLMISGVVVDSVDGESMVGVAMVVAVDVMEDSRRSPAVMHQAVRPADGLTAISRMALPLTSRKHRGLVVENHVSGKPAPVITAC